MVQKCKKNLVAIAAMVSFVSVASNSSEMLTEADLKCFFESIEQKGTNVVFTTHKSGMRFVYAINGKSERDEKVSEYGESITLPNNSVLTLYDWNRFLKVSPSQMKVGHKGFQISLEKDFRSRPGGILTTNKAYMVYLDEKPDSSGGEQGSAAPEGNRAMAKSSGAPGKGAERKCLKGLTLLPCEEKEQ